MNEPINTIEMMLKSIESYGRVSIELFRLKVVSLAAEIISSLFAMLIIGIIVLLFLMMMNIGLAIWLGKITGSEFEGFFIVGSFYGVIASMIFLFRNKWIKSPVQQAFITTIKHRNT